MAVQVTKITLDTRVLDRLTAQMQPRAQQILAGAAFAVQREAAKRAPVDTSALANSIEAVQAGPYLWRVQDGVEYGIYQELGFIHYRTISVLDETPSMSIATGQFIQNPFMVPAVEHIRPHFERDWAALFV